MDDNTPTVIGELIGDGFTITMEPVTTWGGGATKVTLQKQGKPSLYVYWGRDVYQGVVSLVGIELKRLAEKYHEKFGG